MNTATRPEEDVALGRPFNFRTLFEGMAMSSIHNSKIVAAKSLEAQLITLYGMVACAAKQEENVDKVAQLWEIMVGICDAFSKEISSLHTSASLDNILDIRRQCEDLRNLHRIAS